MFSSRIRLLQHSPTTTAAKHKNNVTVLILTVVNSHAKIMHPNQD